MIYPDLPKKGNFQHFSTFDQKADSDRVNHKPAFASPSKPRRSQWIEEAINTEYPPQTAVKAYECYFNGVSQ